MKVVRNKDNISILSQNDFNIKDILECGQIFSFVKINDNEYNVISSNKLAKVCINNNVSVIYSNDLEYFYNFFDLNTDYTFIKKQIININKDYSNCINLGAGIRILKQDAFQTIISFIISANNNIKRIKNILFKMSEKFGSKIENSNYYAFPTLKQLLKATEKDFYELGAGYRSEYLVDTLKKLNTEEFSIENLNKLSTEQLKQKLLTLKGVGPKVADCILLFGFSRTDVFPVDTWIRKAYYNIESKKLSDEKISSYFVSVFKNLSGYAQQYLFNYMLNYSQKDKIL